jgi:hypothetical protein
MDLTICGANASGASGKRIMQWTGKTPVQMLCPASFNAIALGPIAPRFVGRGHRHAMAKPRHADM